MIGQRILYVPGNDHILLRDAGKYPVDAILFDLEEGVPPEEKDEARLLVYHTLTECRYPDSRILIVNINPLRDGTGVVDLELIVRTGRALIRLPKVQSAHDVQNCDLEIARIERRAGMQVGITRMLAVIESAEGALHAQEIAQASSRLVGIAVGAESFLTAADFEEEVFGATDEIGFVSPSPTTAGEMSEEAEKMVFLHEIFAPTPREVQQAKEVLAAVEQMRREDPDALETMREIMIDSHMVQRARRILQLAHDSDMFLHGEPM